MRQASKLRSFEAGLRLCLLRLGAVTIDCGLLSLLAMVVLAPALTAALMITFGYLESFKVLFESMLNVILVYLLAASLALTFLVSYYPCRLESSEWQGTPGKLFLGLKCSDLTGARQSTASVAWRLLLQLLIITFLSLLVSLSASSQFCSLVRDVTSTASLKGSADVNQWTKLSPVLLVAPYLMALFTAKNQTLIDLMVKRIVSRQAKQNELKFHELAANCFRAVLSSPTPSKGTKHIAAGILLTFASLWAVATLIAASTLVTLPLTMAQADQMFHSQNPGALEQYRQKCLFQHLDLVYALLARSKVGSPERSTQSLSAAIMLNPHQHIYWYWRAQNLLAENKPVEALADASKAIDTFTNDSAILAFHSVFGNCRVRLGSEKEVDEGSLYSLRAAIEQKLGDNTSAFQDLTRAVKSAQHAGEYKEWLKLHDLIKKQKEREEQIHLAKVSAIANEAYKILLKSPARFQHKKDMFNQMTALNNIGVGALGQDDFDGAIEKFQKALKIAVKLKTGDVVPPDTFEQAFKRWQTALDLDVRYDLAWRNLSIAYNGKAKTFKNPQTALTYFHRALYFDPLNEPAQFNTAEIIKQLGLDPESSGDHIKLAEVAASTNDLMGACVEYSLALKLKEDPLVKRNLARIKSKMTAESLE